MTLEPSDWLMLLSIGVTFLVSAGGLWVAVLNSRGMENLQRETNRQHQALTLLEQRQTEAIEQQRLRQTETLELAKLASALWDKQAVFAGEFLPAVTELRDQILRSGYMPTEESTRASQRCRSILLRYSAVLPGEVGHGLSKFLENIDTMFLQADTGFRLPEGLGKKEIIEEAGRQVGELFKKAGFPAQEQALRDLLLTDELFSARRKALGLLNEKDK